MAALYTAANYNAMENETQQLNTNIEKMLEALEKAQDNIAESIDSLLVKMGEVEASINSLKRLIAKGNISQSTINNIDDDTIEGDDDEQPSALDELSDFDADDDLSDDDLKRLGYDM
jgi:peptidoglycan hydrolase CwlO-like protein